MKIIIKSEEHHFHLAWPLALLPVGFLCRLISSEARENMSKVKIKEDPWLRKQSREWRRTVKAMKKELLKYVRKHGHLTLVDVVSADGEIVKIVI
jgi:hypothetical protein